LIEAGTDDGAGNGLAAGAAHGARGTLNNNRVVGSGRHG